MYSLYYNNLKYLSADLINKMKKDYRKDQNLQGTLSAFTEKFLNLQLTCDEEDSIKTRIEKKTSNLEYDNSKFSEINSMGMAN